VWKNIFKAILVAVSYYSLKKVIERVPACYRPYATFALRASVFFILFLVLFAFLSSRVNAIGRNAEVLSQFVMDVFLGISFLVTILLSFLLTAFVEEMYRKISEVHQKVEGGIKTAAETPGKMVEQTVGATKKAAQSAGEAARSLYKTVAKVTGSAMDQADELFRKALQSEMVREKCPQAGRAISQAATKTGTMAKMTAGKAADWSKKMMPRIVQGTQSCFSAASQKMRGLFKKQTDKR
jgi:hypothetical protein